MTLLLHYILFTLMSTGIDQINREHPFTTFNISDSILIEAHASLDHVGLIDAYTARIFTPVCEGKKCYAVELDFHWDPIGRFLYSDSIPGKGLTKLDHIPFTKADYQKLNSILRNPYSLLAGYTTEELVKDTRGSSIDGRTGATALALRNSIVEGAVYSCHTLWHIANGPVRDSLQKLTLSMLSLELVQKLVDLSDQEISYFLIRNFTDRDFSSYLPEVLQSMKESEGYYAKNAIELMPAVSICSIPSQEFFAEFYPRMDYFARVALLEKLNAEDLTEDLKLTLSQDNDERNTYKAELISKLISPQ